jgi:uncharacterized protein (TIGR03086 family)
MLIERTRPDQASLPTPCTEWNVRQLINHFVFDVESFAHMLRREPRGAEDADLIGDNWSAAYRAAADGLMNAWRERGTEGTLSTRIGEFPASWAIGQHTAAVAVHAWDVARATHQPTDLDAEVGEISLAWARQNLKPQFRGQAFAPEIPIADTAPIYSRLAAYFGRDPT